MYLNQPNTRIRRIHQSLFIKIRRNGKKCAGAGNESRKHYNGRKKGCEAKILHPSHCTRFVGIFSIQRYQQPLYLYTVQRIFSRRTYHQRMLTYV